MDDRRKRILYRATHRGTKEADFVVGGFFRETAAAIPDAKLDEADALLDVPDLDLMDWLMGRLPVPDDWRDTLFDQLLAYYQKLGQK
ncbi:MAG: succinate dehydrogenase assembly factor 2 [Rhodospirillaceae bacterium]